METRDQGVGAGHYLDGLEDGVFQGLLLRKFFDEVRDDFGVRFGDELVAFGEELIFQLDIVLDDSVVHDHDFAGAIAVRVRVFFGGAAVRGPARVPDAVEAVERSDANGFFKISQFARGAPNFELAVVAHDGDARRIVAAVFEALQAVEDQRDDAFRSDVSDDSAHLNNAPRRCLFDGPLARERLQLG